MSRRHKSPTGGEPTQLETLLKKPEVKRDQDGRFERHGKTLAKTQKKTGLNNRPNNRPVTTFQPGQSGNPRGRSKGSKHKTTLALREQILASLDGVGGVENLKRLDIENSSGYGGLRAKGLPSKLGMPESSGGVKEKGTFERVIGWPDGHREIEGVTPKQLPKPNQESMAYQPRVGENVDIEDDKA